MMDIETLIPHRGRMKLVDTVLSTDGNRAETESTVTGLWPLVSGNAADPILLIELVAQTSAVCISGKAPESAGSPSGEKGWLVGVKKADFFVSSIPVGGRIRVSVEITASLDQYTEIRGMAHMDDTCLGEIAVQVMKEGE